MSENDLLEQAKTLAGRAYKVNVWEDTLSNGETSWMATNPDLPGCLAHGETIEDAIWELSLARVDFIFYMLVDGLAIPEPTESMTAWVDRFRGEG